MREIKFMVWIEEKKEIIVNPTLLFDDGEVSIDIGKACHDFDSCKPVVMQFTGLTDKNGVEIYEGDIVTGDYRGGEVDYTKSGSVYFGLIGDSDGYDNETISGWTVDNKSSLYDLVKFGGCEVIGNKYQNPELLEGDV